MNRPEDNKKGEKQSKANVNKQQTQQNQGQTESLPDSAVVIDHSKLKYMIDIFKESAHGSKLFKKIFLKKLVKLLIIL